MHNTHWPVQYEEIIQRVEEIQPALYAKTRNFIDGKVSRLSPYISRGVVSLPMIMRSVLQKHKRYECEKFIQELAWREYWQRTWEAKGDAIFSDLKRPQEGVEHNHVPVALMEARTGITVIDKQIKHLQETGYIHNHIRMYIASIACNIGKAHWWQPARWMYYHLLDGDLASNSLSWQWVAGSNATKKYYCNQDNVNHYTKTNQTGTFLDYSYEELPGIPVPEALQEKSLPLLTTALPAGSLEATDAQKVFVYNSYNMDPLWRKDEKGLRVLLMEPAHFAEFPVSPVVLRFIMDISGMIPGILVFSGSFHELKARFPEAIFHYKKHPLTTHYSGHADEPDYMFPGVSGYYPSFMSYWKQCEKQWKKMM